MTQPATKCFRNNLGLVCITHSDEVRFRNVTRKRLLQFEEETQREMLREIYAANIERLQKAIDFCERIELNLYRMTSGLFPFSDEAIGAEIRREFAETLKQTGANAIKNNLRLVLHPDQFVVLSSDSPQVVANSIKILQMHADTMDLLGQPRSEWAAMNIHGGKSNRADQMVAVIETLPEAIRLRLVLENDEYAYSAAEILDICQRAKVPMVFDAHHHVVSEKLETYEHPSMTEMFEAARSTWKNPAWQIVHISNGREKFTDRAHSDLIFTMPSVFRRAPFIEVEAKHKELAIENLKNDWLNGKD